MSNYSDWKIAWNGNAAHPTGAIPSELLPASEWQYKYVISYPVSLSEASIWMGSSPQKELTGFLTHHIGKLFKVEASLSFWVVMIVDVSIPGAAYWTWTYLHDKETRTYLKWKEIDYRQLYNHSGIKNWLIPKQVIGNVTTGTVVNVSSTSVFDSSQIYPKNLLIGKRISFVTGEQSDQDYIVKENDGSKITVEIPNSINYDLSGTTTTDVNGKVTKIDKPVKENDVVAFPNILADTVLNVESVDTLKWSIYNTPSQQNYAPDLFANERVAFTSGEQEGQIYTVKNNDYVSGKATLTVITPNSEGYYLDGKPNTEGVKEKPIVIGDSFSITNTSAWYVVDIILSNQLKHQPSGKVVSSSADFVTAALDYTNRNAYAVPSDHAIDGWSFKVTSGSKKDSICTIESFTQTSEGYVFQLSDLTITAALAPNDTFECYGDKYSIYGAGNFTPGQNIAGIYTTSDTVYLTGDWLSPLITLALPQNSSIYIDQHTIGFPWVGPQWAVYFIRTRVLADVLSAVDMIGEYGILVAYPKSINTFSQIFVDRITYDQGYRKETIQVTTEDSVNHVYPNVFQRRDAFTVIIYEDSTNKKIKQVESHDFGKIWSEDIETIPLYDEDGNKVDATLPTAVLNAITNEIYLTYYVNDKKSFYFSTYSHKEKEGAVEASIRWSLKGIKIPFPEDTSSQKLGLRYNQEENIIEIVYIYENKVYYLVTMNSGRAFSTAEEFLSNEIKQKIVGTILYPFRASQRSTTDVKTLICDNNGFLLDDNTTPSKLSDRVLDTTVIPELVSQNTVVLHLKDENIWGIPVLKDGNVSLYLSNRGTEFSEVEFLEEET